MRVEMLGLSRLDSILKFLMSDSGYKQVMMLLAAKALEMAMEFSPEMTGAMEEAIELREVSSGWELFIDGRTIPYAYYNEFGTYKIPAGKDGSNPIPYVSTSGKACYRPFLRTAAYRALDELNKIVDDWFKNNVK